MIARLKTQAYSGFPVIDHAGLLGESDVEQKYIYPFLTHTSFLGLPSLWVRTRQYMASTDLDKGAGRRTGYFPDYSIWVSGLPLIVVEAKSPDETVSLGLREARLYAGEINRRYPPKVNPISFALACNGRELALCSADSETDVFTASVEECMPGSAALEFLKNTIGKAAVEKLAAEAARHFETRRFHRVAGYMGGQAKLSQQLGVNQFAEDLFPLIVKYFGNEAEEAIDEIIQRAYVSSNELTTYDAVLETYLKDRVEKIGMGAIKPIVTSKSAESGITGEISKFAENPSLYGRVQLIIGAVGAGKSTFVRRYFYHLMPTELRARTLWAFINFNVMPPGLVGLKDWIAEQFIRTFAAQNQIDLDDLQTIERIFAGELNRYDRGPAKLIKEADNLEYLRRKSTILAEWVNDRIKFSENIARHYSGERQFGIEIVFDNVDRRGRDAQLAIFEAAQWLKELTRSLVLVNLRDSTFDAYRDQPPLDAFVNAINFYVRPPRFAQVIQKRMELILEKLSVEVKDRQEFSLKSGIKISYPASKLGTFLMTIYLSLFDARTTRIAASIEALVAKDVRRALGMFADIIVSPHIPTAQITGTLMAPGSWRMPEYQVIRALMRGRYRYFGGQSPYIKNLLSANPDHTRPSNFLYLDILEYLTRIRKKQVDFAQEGYVLAETVMKNMGQLGYDELDALSALRTLVGWGLVEPENLVIDELTEREAVRNHAAGYIHLKFYCTRAEYVVGVTPDIYLASPSAAEAIGALWAGARGIDISTASKRKIAEILADYFKQEYDRRVRRHPFYLEHGHGGRQSVEFIQEALVRF